MTCYGLAHSFSDLSQITTAQFADLHLDYITSHPPDAVLFPFLHGLEGSNEAQNMFFATQGQSVLTTTPGDGESQPARRNTVPVPKYRGLMAVVCEDDLESPSQLGLLDKSYSYSSNCSDNSDYDFDDDDESEEYELDDELAEPEQGQDAAMHMDVDVVDIPEDSSPIHPHNAIQIVGIGSDEKHMHPVHHRLPPVKPIQTTNLDSTDSSASSSLSSCEDSLFETGDATATPATSPSSPSPSLSSKSKSKPATPKTPSSALGTPRKRRPHTPLLTSTFRAKDLIRPVDSTEDQWEFIPMKVPEGISLRNFGIQVPILATLSDIVVYSPTSRGASRSDNALQLANRLRMAIERKRKERCERLGLDVDAKEALLRYNVFLLDATAEQIRSDIPHLVMRVCQSGQVPGSLGPGAAKQNNFASSPPPSSDGFEMDMDDDVVMADSPSHLTHLSPNTVDFAQRERDEMRDLTKASEIISVFPDRSSPPSPLHVDFSTTATHFDPMIGQLFLGNSNDVPLPLEGEEEPDERIITTDSSSFPALLPASPSSSLSSSCFSSEQHPLDDLPPLPRAHPLNPIFTNSPEQGHGYDICIECHDMAPFPTQGHLKAAEEKISLLEEMWRRRLSQTNPSTEGVRVPPRPPPHANSVIHLPFPSSPVSSPTTMSALMPVIKFLERCLMPPPTEPVSRNHSSTSSSFSRRWSSVSSFIPSLPSFPIMSSSVPLSTSSRTRSFTSPPVSNQRQSSELPPLPWSRPLKILLYSSDGYTESSVPALCLLMAVKGLSLPEAYLELQVVKRRSFFVYQYDLGILRRVEGRLSEERRERERETQQQQEREREREGGSVRRSAPTSVSFNPYAGHWGGNDENQSRPPLPSSTQFPQLPAQQQTQRHAHTRLQAKSVSFAQSPLLPKTSNPSDGTSKPTMDLSSPIDVPSQCQSSAKLPQTPLSSSLPRENNMNAVTKTRRPRASTSPWLPSLFGDHQAWFNDPRFDGSFPSRVLPFLYLGNLAHASNAYMLHALGITHVVSVGECALVPPPNMQNLLNNQSSASCSVYPYPGPSSSHFIQGKGPGHQGSLWIEERAGRIKVLDIQGVCDDGIDTLEPQLEPICEWIDKARKEGGQVLVHCRVGVSRSATVTIAYVMKHLGLPLVDAYLIVRSRRLSVLIQPNMRLLYNLCDWEIKLAKERAGDDREKLRNELSCALSWPYLAKEVHALNEKYLH